MKSRELKVARIGNSRGVRLPAETLSRYRIGSSVLMEERVDGILLRPPEAEAGKLTWEETAREMAAVAEDWSEWDATLEDDLANVPWGKVAEGKAPYGTRRATRKKHA